MGGSGESGPKEGLELDVFEAPGLQHRLFEGVFDDDDRGADSLLVISGISREVTQESTVGVRATGIILELQVDIPETALVTDGREVVPRGRGRRRRLLG